MPSDLPSCFFVDIQCTALSNISRYNNVYMHNLHVHVHVYTCSFESNSCIATVP